jgi:hypothetical protein
VFIALIRARQEWHATSTGGDAKGATLQAIGKKPQKQQFPALLARKLRHE